MPRAPVMRPPFFVAVLHVYARSRIYIVVLYKSLVRSNKFASLCFVIDKIRNINSVSPPPPTSLERSPLHKVLTFDFTLYVIDSSICYRDLWLNIIYFHVQVRHYLSLFTNKCIGIMLKDGDGVNPCFIRSTKYC